MTAPAKKLRKGGRPSLARAALIEDEILAIAARLFLSQGYGATSIESIAQQAGMSKRTFYHRFANKGELFAAVVHRLVTRLRPAHTDDFFSGDAPLEAMLLRLATALLQVSLTPDALAMHRLMVSEASRFPELGQIMTMEGARQEAVERIAALLQSRAPLPGFTRENARFAAEQFMQLVVAVPQRRALGLGTPMDAAEREEWAQVAVRLFLHGLPGIAAPADR